MSKKTPQNSENPAKSWPRLLVVNDPFPMRIYRELAVEIGFEESVILLQLEYLIATSTSEIKDGLKWTYQSLDDFHQYFPWWSLPTLSRILERMEKKGYIMVGNYNKLGYDRTRWYTLGPGILTLKSVTFDNPIFHFEKWIFQNEKWIFQNETSIFHFDNIHFSNCAIGSAQIETTIPKTLSKTLSKTPTEIPSSSSYLLPENQEEEEEGHRFLSEAIIAKLLEFGIFDTKIDQVEQLAMEKGWTEDQLIELMARCKKDTSARTPQGAFLYRIEKNRPPKKLTEVFAEESPATGEIEPDEEAEEIWDQAKIELEKKIGKGEYLNWFANGSCRPQIDGYRFILRFLNPSAVERGNQHLDQIKASLQGLLPPNVNFVMVDKEIYL